MSSTDSRTTTLRALEDYVSKSSRADSNVASEIEIPTKESLVSPFDESNQDILPDFDAKVSACAKEKWLDNVQFIDSIQDKVRSDPIAAKFRETLDLIKELQASDTAATATSNNSTDETVAGRRSLVDPAINQQPTFDWSEMYTLSSNVLDSYSERIESIFNELERVQRFIGYWQESGFTFDAHRGAQVVNRAEEWAKGKEQFLSYRRKQLDTTVKEISDTVSRLEKTD